MTQVTTTSDVRMIGSSNKTCMTESVGRSIRALQLDSSENLQGNKWAVQEATARFRKQKGVCRRRQSPTSGCVRHLPNKV
eukprot:6026410-Amphidinium_carterae.1